MDFIKYLADNLLSYPLDNKLPAVCFYENISKKENRFNLPISVDLQKPVARNGNEPAFVLKSYTHSIHFLEWLFILLMAQLNYDLERKRKTI